MLPRTHAERRGRTGGPGIVHSRYTERRPIPLPEILPLHSTVSPRPALPR